MHKRLETRLTPEITNELLKNNELTVFDASVIYAKTKQLDRPLHFEYINGEWTCVAGE